MSAFDRHPLRKEYENAARAFPRRDLGGIGGAKGWSVNTSPQNRRVRYAVDLDQARARTDNLPIPNTRQIRRQVARLGPAAYAPSAQALAEQQRGPEEV